MSGGGVIVRSRRESSAARRQNKPFGENGDRLARMAQDFETGSLMLASHASSREKTPNNFFVVGLIRKKGRERREMVPYIL